MQHTGAEAPIHAEASERAAAVRRGSRGRAHARAELQVRDPEEQGLGPSGPKEHGLGASEPEEQGLGLRGRPELGRRGLRELGVGIRRSRGGGRRLRGWRREGSGRQVRRKEEVVRRRR